jgi:predicted O-methyltransferase YrrM
MVKNILRKVLPVCVKQTLVASLRRIPCASFGGGPVVAAGKPGTENRWWTELKRIRNRKIFVSPGSEAQTACAEIRKAYGPVLQRYGVNSEDFFWGSIKNEEAEALYQMVLDRKPGIVYQVGTFVGYSALVIAHALRANGSGILVAVDPEIPHRTFINPVNIAREAARDQGLDTIIRFERGWHSGALGDYIGLGLKRTIPIVGLQVLESIRGQGIDLAFIDGDHSTACTLTDFLLLKDYLNIKGVAVFHDVLSWPTVAQAIFLIWHDIHYFVRGTSAYFSLDIRAGHDGLAALERIAEENCPTMRLLLVGEDGHPVADAAVTIADINFSAISDKEGAVFILQEVPAGVEIRIVHENFADYTGTLEKGTAGDFVENLVSLAPR